MAAPTVLFTLLTLLALAPFPARGLGCTSDPTIPGAESLKELYETMLDDFDAVVLQGQGDDGGAEPPHVYYLCPGRTYDVQDEDYWIEPLLDGTVVQCGSEGKSADGCIVKGGALQVVLTESREDGYVRETTSFRGITFEDSSDLSVAAYDTSDTVAEFVDCHWRGSTGGFVVQLAHAERVGDTVGNNTNERRRKLGTGRGGRGFDKDLSKHNLWTSLSEPGRDRHLQDDVSGGMEIIYKDCTISATSSLFGLANVDGTLTLEGVAFENNPYVQNFSIFAVWNEATAYVRGSRFTESDYLVNLANFRGDLFVETTEFHSNQGQASVGIVGGTTSVDDCKFINNDHPTTGNIDATEGAFVDVSYCEFSHTQNAQADIIVIGGSDLFLQDSCFFSGNYALSPVFVGGNSTLGDSFNNYAESLSSSTTSTSSTPCIDPAGVFVQQPGSDYMNCFDKNETTTCAGTCRGDFDAKSCGFDRTTMAPSPAPPPPTPPTLRPTEMERVDVPSSAVRLLSSSTGEGAFHWLSLPLIASLGCRWVGR